MKHEEYGSSNSCTDLFIGKEISQMNIARFFIFIGSVYGTCMYVHLVDFYDFYGKCRYTYASPMGSYGIYVRPKKPKTIPVLTVPSGGVGCLASVFFERFLVSQVDRLPNN